MKQARHRDAILRMDPEVLILLSSIVGTRGGRRGIPKWKISIAEVDGPNIKYVQYPRMSSSQVEK